MAGGGGYQRKQEDLWGLLVADRFQASGETLTLQSKRNRIENIQCILHTHAQVSVPHTHACAHTYIFLHRHTPAHTHAHTHTAHIHACAHMHTQTCMHINDHKKTCVTFHFYKRQSHGGLYIHNPLHHNKTEYCSSGGYREPQSCEATNV